MSIARAGVYVCTHVPSSHLTFRQFVGLLLEVREGEQVQQLQSHQEHDKHAHGNRSKTKMKKRSKSAKQLYSRSDRKKGGGWRATPMKSFRQQASVCAPSCFPASAEQVKASIHAY